MPYIPQEELDYLEECRKDAINAIQRSKFSDDDKLWINMLISKLTQQAWVIRHKRRTDDNEPHA